jgi:SpoVK/Ycf46/Vps4 family AAA+-type ATPase
MSTHLIPDAIKNELRTICDRVPLLGQQAGKKSKSTLASSDKGIRILFVGAHGMGKSLSAHLAAQWLASELSLELLRLDLSSVVSKYIGETEKNLDRIFGAAQSANLILFFDEADALFGKRTEVKDAHDRYANLEVSYLLRKIADYSGVAILTSSRRENIDAAFLRQMDCVIDF